MIKTIFFDLDGTLLGMDEEKFVELYFKYISKYATMNGLDCNLVCKGVYSGMSAMHKNNGTRTNEDSFWDAFCLTTKFDLNYIKPLLYKYYESEYDNVKCTTKTLEKSKDCIDLLYKKGYDLVLATNPLFPPVATIKRIIWGNMDYKKFKHITTYDNSHFCKPNIGYYKELLKDLNPDEVLMVGNDVTEDIVIKELGVKTFLVTDYYKNGLNKNYISDYQGTYDEMIQFLNNLLALKN